MSSFFDSLRAAYRKRFTPKPPRRLDGFAIQFRTMIAMAANKKLDYGAEWDRQCGIRGQENRDRVALWLTGIKWRDHW